MPSIRRAAHLIFLISGILVLAGPVIVELDPTSFVNSQLTRVQFLVLELHLGLLAYWTHRAATREEPVMAAVALAFAAVSAVTGIWVVHYVGSDAAVFLAPTPTVIGFALSTIALVLTAAFDAAGKPLTLITMCTLAFGYLGQFAPQFTSVPRTYFTSYLTFLAYGSDGLLGLALEIIVGIVLVFVMFGVFFEAAGGGRVIEAVALRLAAGGRTNAVKACVLASGIFGTISGSAVSNALTSGAFSIPSMRKIGLRGETAAGIEAAASTCGQIMPPVLGVAAFFLADLAGVSYRTVVIASVGPALACYYALFRQSDLVIVDGPLPAGAIARPPMQRSWLLFLLPPAAIAYVLLLSEAYVATAAIAGTAMCVVVSLLLQGWRLSLARLRERLQMLLSSVVQLVIIAATVGLLLGALSSTGLAVAGAIMIGKIGENNLALALGLAAASSFILGMGVATVGVYVVAASLLTPGLIKSGIPPLAAHFFVLYCSQISMITPPVAFASLAASGLAEADFWATCRWAMRFGWMLFVVPFVIILKPGLLMLGGWQDIVVAYLVTFAFINVATTPRLRWWARLPLVAVCAIAIAWSGPQWIALALATAALALPFLRKMALSPAK